MLLPLTSECPRWHVGQVVVAQVQPDQLQQPLERVRRDVVNLVAAQAQRGHDRQPPEGLLGQVGDPVVVQVELLETAQWGKGL